MEDSHLEEVQQGAQEETSLSKLQEQVSELSQGVHALKEAQLRFGMAVQVMTANMLTLESLVLSLVPEDTQKEYRARVVEAINLATTAMLPQSGPSEVMQQALMDLMGKPFDISTGGSSERQPPRGKDRMEGGNPTQEE